MIKLPSCFTAHPQTLISHQSILATLIAGISARLTMHEIGIVIGAVPKEVDAMSGDAFTDLLVYVMFLQEEAEAYEVHFQKHPDKLQRYSLQGCLVVHINKLKEKK